MNTKTVPLKGEIWVNVAAHMRKHGNMSNSSETDP